MKTIQFVFVILCLPIFIQAQIKIYPGDLNFNALTTQVDFTSVNVNSVAIPQVSANALWDYSNLVTTGDFSVTFQSTADYQLCSSNLKQSSSIDVFGHALPSFKHLQYTYSGLTIEGHEYAPANLSLGNITGNYNDSLYFLGEDWLYTTPESELIFPVQFNDTYSSTNQDTLEFVANIPALGWVNFAFNQITTRSVSYHIIGWGNMILPNPEKQTLDTFEVLLRKKVVLETSTFVDNAGNLLPNSLLSTLGYNQVQTIMTIHHTFYTKGANHYAFEITERGGNIIDAHYNAGVFETLPERIFVNAAAQSGGNGISWASAYTDLSDAIEDAKAGDEIWVVQGTYLPGGENPTVNASFNIPEGVKIYGGFAGTESDLNQRDVINNVTILSGDLEMNDISGNNSINRTDNVHHIMTFDYNITNSTVVDGFTFSSGHCDGSGLIESKGGGAIFSYGSPLLANNTFTNNYAVFGGAICSKSENAAYMLVDNCSFSNNRATNNGGAVCIFSSGGIFENSVFMFNESENYGGGAIAVNDADVEITNCIFQRNKAVAGGAIRLTNLMDTTFLMITGSTFIDNNATTDGGGAIYNSSTSTTMIDDCLFENNYSTLGGAILSLSRATTIIQESQFNDNSTDNFGGAIAVQDVDLSIFSTYFSGNEAVRKGGALFCSNSEVHLMNALITDNKLNNGYVGGAIYNQATDGQTGSLNITNSTIANNQGIVGGIVQDEGANADLTLTLVNTIFSNSYDNYKILNGSPITTSLGGNLSSDLTLQSVLNHISDQNQIDPLFVDAANKNYKLSAISPAVDAGIINNTPVTDIEGILRTAVPDAGAYEYINTVTVDTEPLLVEVGEVTTFPNPATTYTTLKINNEWTGTVNVQVVNMTGAIVSSWEINKYQNLYQEQISTEDLPQGTYQIVVHQLDKKHTVSFMKI